jgi:hypothetical protein
MYGFCMIVSVNRDYFLHINKFIFEMKKYCVFFEVWTEFLNIVWMSFSFRGLIRGNILFKCLNVIVLFFLQYPMTILYDPARKKEPSPQYVTERETCLKYFERWSEQDQVEFVEHLLSRMCHYQHGHINSYLKPMLQRDFISLLPSM